MQDFINHLASTYHFNNEAIDSLQSNLRLLKYPKGTTIIPQGTLNSSIYFIRKGVLRTFILRNEEEITLWFSVPGDFELSPWCHIKGIPSQYNITASSYCEVLELPHKFIQKLSKESITFSHFLNDMYGDIILKTGEILIALASPRATDRYLSIMRRILELFLSVPQKEVARFLGITPQSLSRIRAQIKILKI